MLIRTNPLVLALSALAAPAPSAAPDVVEGFRHPESARYDPDVDVWFVGNINGDPFAEDDNGFISRLKGDGSMDSLEFITGGKNGVTLNAPKGMAITSDTLWAADVDVVRAFARRTGASLANVSLKGKAKFLNDLVAGPDGILFTNWADSTLDVLENGKVPPIGDKLPSPADIGIDTRRGRVAIPLLMEDRVEFRPLPASTP